MRRSSPSLHKSFNFIPGKQLKRLAWEGSISEFTNSFLVSFTFIRKDLPSSVSRQRHTGSRSRNEKGVLQPSRYVPSDTLISFGSFNTKKLEHKDGNEIGFPSIQMVGYR